VQVGAACWVHFAFAQEYPAGQLKYATEAAPLEQTLSSRRVLFMQESA
jgi:hypothetical protein